MSAYEILGSDIVLDNINDNELIKLCVLSHYFSNICIDYLPSRSFANFGESVGRIQEYIQLLTRKGDVVEGSERYIPVEDALFRAAMLGDRVLVSYFQELIPDSCKRLAIPLLVATVNRDAGAFKEYHSRTAEHCARIGDLDCLLGNIISKLKARRKVVGSSVEAFTQVPTRKPKSRCNYGIITDLGSVELAVYLLTNYITSTSSRIRFIESSNVEFLEEILETYPSLMDVSQHSKDYLRPLVRKQVSPNILLKYVNRDALARVALSAKSGEELNSWRYFDIFTPRELRWLKEKEAWLNRGQLPQWLTRITTR